MAKSRRNLVRPASHAGRAYADDPAELRRELKGYFHAPKGPGSRGPAAADEDRILRAIVSPHIDPGRGGPTYAWAYQRLAWQCPAELFVILGTAHHPLRQWFAVSRQDFATPLGVVETDRDFVDKLAGHLAESVAGRLIDPLEDESAHRVEHSIEFQAVFLQYLLGPRRPLRIVPILVSSFYEFIAAGCQPDASPEIAAFIAALKATVAEHPGHVGYIGGVDLAHIGPEFGDPQRLGVRRLAQLAGDDRELLQRICRTDARGMFRHVAAQDDGNRICGLAPLYVLLEAIGPASGELLRYDQAVAPGGLACVSFASAAFYEPLTITRKIETKGR
jgi:AmmeMemoRadiSam system protein B